jgi:hypothetical protein
MFQTDVKASKTLGLRLALATSMDRHAMAFFSRTVTIYGMSAAKAAYNKRNLHALGLHLAGAVSLLTTILNATDGSMMTPVTVNSLAMERAIGKSAVPLALSWKWKTMLAS